MPSIPDLPEPLSDGVIQIRHAAERDIPEILIAHQDDPEMYVRLGQERPPTGAQLGTMFEHAAAERAAGVYAALTILEPGSDTCRGGMSVHNVDWVHARAELGIWLAPQVRGRGLASRALGLAAGWLLAVVGLHRVAVLTEPGNEPMLAAARASAFVFEGVLREYTLERGRRVDNAILSRLSSDLAP
jgi:RimJ/RimL family protein N-acetyltransferase